MKRWQYAAQSKTRYTLSIPTPPPFPLTSQNIHVHHAPVADLLWCCVARAGNRSIQAGDSTAQNNHHTAQRLHTIMSAGLPCRCQGGSSLSPDTIISAGMLHHSQSTSRSPRRGSNKAQCCHQTVHRLNTIMPAGMLCHSQSGNRFTKPGNNTLRCLLTQSID